METPTNTSLPETVASPTNAETSAPTPELSQADKVRAAINLPADQFMLGDRLFYIKDLEYDDYLKFVLLLEPVIKLFLGQMGQAVQVAVPGINLNVQKFSPSALVTYCGETLPEMVRMICAQTDPNITVAEVKKLGKTPITLANIVIKQIVQNGIFHEFADFFGQILPLMKTYQ